MKIKCFFAEVAQLVVRQLADPKLRVEGSNPFYRSLKIKRLQFFVTFFYFNVKTFVNYFLKTRVNNHHFCWQIPLLIFQANNRIV